MIKAKAAGQACDPWTRSAHARRCSSYQSDQTLLRGRRGIHWPRRGRGAPRPAVNLSAPTARGGGLARPWQEGLALSWQGGGWQGPDLAAT